MKHTWHWIPVDQALPPLDQVVLIDTDDSTVGYQVAYRTLVGDPDFPREAWIHSLNGEWVDNLYVTQGTEKSIVTHWAPIFGPNGESPEWWENES